MLVSAFMAPICYARYTSNKLPACKARMLETPEQQVWRLETAMPSSHSVHLNLRAQLCDGPPAAAKHIHLRALCRQQITSSTRQKGFAYVDFVR